MSNTNYTAPFLYIDGEFIEGGDRPRQDIVNPANGQVIGSLPHARRDDLDRALLAAQRAFEGWRKSSPLERSRVLRRVAELTRGQGVDRIIELDMAANAAANLDMLKTGGECVAYGSGASPMSVPFYPLIVKNLQLKCFMVYHLNDADRARAETTLTRLLRTDALQHNVAERLPLAQTALAHERVESGQVVGNVVIGIDLAH